MSSLVPSLHIDKLFGKFGKNAQTQPLPKNIEVNLHKKKEKKTTENCILKVVPNLIGFNQGDIKSCSCKGILGQCATV